MTAPSGILLDIGCGNGKYGTNWVGIDKRALPGVDIIHDLEVFPYPIESDSVLTARMSHVIEHIKPWFIIDVMNEIWRIMKPEGQLYIAAPYGLSYRYIQDPTHCSPINEHTFFYFDPHPAHLDGGVNILYNQYQPKPWKIEMLYTQQNLDIECVMSKRVPPPPLNVFVADSVKVEDRAR